MDKEPLLPYFHPTTVVVVDDNQLFLHTLDLRMPAEMAYQLHHDPRLALTNVNQKLRLATIPERCLKRDRTAWKGTISFDFSMIEEEIKLTDRFNRTSVVIVDYAMPQMSGLEFCRDIADPSVKKVLLTGVADEKIAVKAFNDGLIDRYVSKNDRATLDLVVSFAHDLQRAYFMDQQRILQSSMSLELPPFLSDPDVREWVHAQRDHSGCVEYYMVGDPPGFILVTSNGDVSRLMIMNEEDVQAGIEFAETYGAPGHILKGLRERKKLGYFYDRPDSAELDFVWADYLHDAVKLGGESPHWVAPVATPPNDIDFDPGATSYQSHLRQIDRAA